MISAMALSATCLSASFFLGFLMVTNGDSYILQVNLAPFFLYSRKKIAFYTDLNLSETNITDVLFHL